MRAFTLTVTLPPQAKDPRKPPPTATNTPISHLRQQTTLSSLEVHSFLHVVSDPVTPTSVEMECSLVEALTTTSMYVAACRQTLINAERALRSGGPACTFKSVSTLQFKITQS